MVEHKKKTNVWNTNSEVIKILSAKWKLRTKVVPRIKTYKIRP